MNSTLRTFPIDQMARVDASKSISPIMTQATTVVGTTGATSHLLPSTSGVNLPNCLIPTPRVLVSTSSTLIPLGGMVNCHYIRKLHRTHFHMGCLQSQWDHQGIFSLTTWFP